MSTRFYGKSILLAGVRGLAIIGSAPTELIKYWIDDLVDICPIGIAHYPYEGIDSIPSFLIYS